MIRPGEAVHVLLSFREDRGLLLRNDHVFQAHRDTGLRGVPEAEVLQLVQEFRGLRHPRGPEHLEHQVTQHTLVHGGVLERHLFGENVVEHDPPDRGHDPAPLIQVQGRPVVVRRPPIRAQQIIRQGDLDIGRARESRQVVLLGHVAKSRRLLRNEVAAQNQVVTRRRDRTPVRRLEHVVAGQHQDPGLELRLERQRHVDRHLVTVEVRVERRAHKRVNADRLALDKDRLEGLDPEPVQRRRPVQEHRVVLDDVLEHLVDLRVVALNKLLGPLHRFRVTATFELVDDEWLEQFDRHHLGQTALVQLQLGTDDDHRTA